MSSALIFGVNGQDGFYLNQLLREHGIAVTGISRSQPAWEHQDWISGDVANSDFVTEIIKKKKPDYVFHLAARSVVGHEFLFEHQATIAQGTVNILESVFRHSPATKVFITGSGLQFKNTGAAISEKDPFDVTNAYTLARVQAVYMARYFRTKGIHSYVGYLFHHDSPLRSAGHLNRQIAETVKKAAAGLDVSLTIGDISVEKEFGFAGDIVAGIFRLVQQDEIEEACIGTGKAYSIADWLETCFSLIGKRWQDYVRYEPGYVPDFKRLFSDPSSMKKIHWEAQTSIEQLAHMMLGI